MEKLPGVRTIGIIEVFRRVIGKVVMKFSKRNVPRATGSLQLWAGQNAGSEVAIYAVYEIFNNKKAEALLMVHPSNVLSTINWKAFLHNTKAIWSLKSAEETICYPNNISSCM